MEYVFGTQKNFEVLKTKGSIHSDLTGFQTIKLEYPDQIITDRFKIVRKIEIKEDSEGNCYDWYEISNHYRIIDKSEALTRKISESVEAIEEALCEIDSNKNDVS